VPVGSANTVARIEFELARVKSPAQLLVSVEIKGTDFRNNWSIWVYPYDVEMSPPARVVVAPQWNELVAEALDQGDKVLLLAQPPTIAGDIPAGFTTIFWNTQWTRGQAPHTLGILCDPKHKALSDFPTEFHSNWQWWDLVAHSRAMILDDLDGKLQPIVQVIDDWNTNRKLGLAFEAKVGAGKLLVCSMDLQTDLDLRPVARQMRHSLLQYVGSSRFKPRVELSIDDVRRLFR